MLNALVHRDYSIHTEGMPIQIIMFEDHIEIKNPGEIYGRIRVDQLGKVQPEFCDERGNFIVKLYKYGEKTSVENLDEIESNELIVFCRTPRTRKEICEYLGLSSVTYAIQTYIMPLVKQGLIKMSMPDKPKSPKQLFYRDN